MNISLPSPLKQWKVKLRAEAITPPANLFAMCSGENKPARTSTRSCWTP